MRGGADARGGGRLGIFLRAMGTASVFAASAIVGAGQSGPPKIETAVTIGDAALDYELLSSSLSPAGDTLLAVIRGRVRDEPTAASQLTVAAIDAGGAVTRTPLPGADMSRARPAAPPLVLHGGAARRYVLRVDSAGVQLEPLALGPEHAPDTARRSAAAIIGATALKGTVSLPAERVLVVAGAGSRALVAEVDLKGPSVTWTRELEDPGLTLSGGQRQASGGFVMVGHMKEPATGQEHVWIGTLDPTGRVTARKTFPGRSAEVAAASDGTIAMVYQRASGTTADIVLRGFRPTLDDRWERVLLTAQAAPPIFRIAGAGQGHFIVVGAENRGLWISRVDGEGGQVWLERRVPGKRPDQEMVLNVDVLRGPKSLVVPYSAFVVDGNQQKRVVRVIRLSEP